MLSKTPHRVFIILILLILLSTIVTVYSISSETKSALKESLQEKLMFVAGIAASDIDGDSFARLHAGDENTSNFIRIRDQLRLVKEVSPEVHFIYTMRKNGDAVEFVVDGDYGYSTAAADIGEKYPQAEPELLAGFSAPSADAEFTTDQWGAVLSGFSPIRDSTGAVVGIVGVDMESSKVMTYLDRINLILYFVGIIAMFFVTGGIIFVERRRSIDEQELQESEERYRTILQTTKDGFWIVDLPEGKITEVNEIYCQMSGYTRAELLKMRIPDLDAIKTLDEQAATLQSVITNGSGIFETHHHRKDGSVFDVELSVTYQNTNSPKLICFCRDITERKQAEAVIHESEQRFHTIFDSARDGMLIVDPDTHRFVMANAAFLKQTGYSETELLTLSVSDIHPPADLPEVIEFFEKQIHAEIGMSSATPILRKDGTVFFADINSCTITLWNRQHTFGIFRDITERKKMADQINASLAEKDVLLKEIHHRVKNNLQIISSMLNMQIRKLDDPKTIDTLRDSQNRVQSLALVHEYLYRGKDLSHIDLKNYITALGKGLFQSYDAAKQGVRFNVNIRDIYVDINTSIPLGLISNELITNSFKYAFRDRKDGMLTITATEDPQALTFVVADNGIGMSPDITFENKTSLGLRLVYSLTGQLNGTVTIDRTEGTKFVFTIPKPDKNKEKA